MNVAEHEQLIRRTAAARGITVVSTNKVVKLTGAGCSITALSFWHIHVLDLDDVDPSSGRAVDRIGCGKW